MGSMSHSLRSSKLLRYEKNFYLKEPKQRLHAQVLTKLGPLQPDGRLSDYRSICFSAFRIYVPLAALGLQARRANVESF